MRTIRTKVYQFSELSEQAKEKAICDFINDFLLFDCSDWDENSPYYEAAMRMEKNKTPWFLAETLYHDYRHFIIADIEANEYNFTKDGKLFTK